MGIRVVAAIGGIVAVIAIAVGFAYGLLWGLVAVVAAPALPLDFVLTYEAVRRTPTSD